MRYHSKIVTAAITYIDCMGEVLRLHEQPRFSREDMEAAMHGFERLAQRLDALWQKKKLTPDEEREVALILNNAMILDEALSGNTPEELNENRQAS